MAHMGRMESHWSIMKSGHDGTYHKMSPKHLQRYVNKFAKRHNVCKESMIDLMRGMVSNMQGRFLLYRMLKKDNGLLGGTKL